MTRVVIVSAGLGSPSTTRLLADQMAAGVRRAEPGASVEVVELRPLAHDVVDATLTGFASPRLQHVIDQVGAADALGFVTPIFQASYSGLFKSFADVLEPDQLIGKPVLLGATGGTARHSLAVEHAMRPLMAYLQAVPVPTGVFASPHDWSAEGEGALTSRVDRAVSELMSLLGGAGTGRTRDDEIDLFSETMLSISDPSRGA
ncbi:CE1759 family FMN reductase [Aeromicrobium sp. 50.2.37]|uniref:CE1759 family FMN reductase n=1 Tax=Aeromicrobium sp. 50.2.37 TaxID=2969305 RepID=UPI002150030B|nr:CE1759 family FMN reductase [Aeromicrobium sp. 50.2.37]MCR4514466.1 NAD(P)H-dependent oxidoreductase [Aeromicrobium sp. 50.2.37]